MSATLRKRRKNAVLAALERVRRVSHELSLIDALVFLYVCENEGVNVSEVAQLAALTQSTASRTSRRLATVETINALPPTAGLLELRGNPNDGRSKTLYLTQLGCEIRTEIEALIAQAQPIMLQRAR
jgi:DNA-binding MarR family transcriptional regulator